MPKISIIVPVYNVEKFLKKCLDSLVNQTLKDIEIIVVDDGSPDDSHVIYEEFASRDSRIKIIKKENAGVSEARNTGMDVASGEFLMFVDSDDWMPLDGCEILYNEYLNTGADMILADVYIASNGNISKNDIFKEAFSTEKTDFFRSYQKACIGYSYNPFPAVKWNIPGLGSPWNKLFKRSIIQLNKLRFDPYVKGIYDDNLFTLHYLMHIKSFSYVKRPVYYFRIVTGSLTQGFKENTLDINSRIFDRINQFMNETGNPEYFREAFYVYVIRRLSKSMNVYFFALNNKKSNKEKYAELNNVLKSEPYRTAIKKVQIGKLLNNHKVVVVMARLGSPRLIHFCLNVKRKLSHGK
jgi:glycosyltransferase involved in cell wall biosynthesis